MAIGFRITCRYNVLAPATFVWPDTTTWLSVAQNFADALTANPGVMIFFTGPPTGIYTKVSYSMVEGVAYIEPTIESLGSLSSDIQTVNAALFTGMSYTSVEPPINVRATLASFASTLSGESITPVNSMIDWWGAEPTP